MIRSLPGGLESPEPHTGRIAPHDTGAEKSVLGALLIDQDAIASIRDTLEPDDFYVERHAQIYRAATALSDRGEPIDTVTLRSELDRHGLLERAGGVAYIAELSVFTPTPVSVRHYADIVADHSLRRRLIRAGADVSALGFDVALGAEAALDTAEQAVFRLSETRHGTEASHLAPIVKELWQMLETRSKEKRLLSGVPTGFRQLDQLTLGLQPGELIVLAARPSVGKTAFALNIARHAAVIEGDPVAIFSLEMGRSALAQRLICSEANVDSYKLRTSQLDAAAYQRIAKAMDQLITADMWIDDTPALSIASLRARARRAKAQRGIKLIVIDYLQLMRGGRQESRVQEVSDISSGLKSIAKELNLPVVALSQLSRESERRENRRPQLSDLRDSGCLAGDTAVLISDEGHTRPIASLVGESGFRTLALNESTWRLEPSRVSRVFSTGHKPLFRMTTALGKQIRATANHRFRTIDAWRRLDELRIGDHLALPRQLPAGSGDSPMASAELALPALAACGMSHRELHAAMGTKFNGSALYDRNLGRARADRVGSVVGSSELSRLATSDVYWDRVTSIVPDGEEDVYDMTVERLHNFVANDIIVHNSIEQDADVVIFLFRPGMHKEDIDRSKTELIVAKNRNGPTRDIELVFLAEQTAFKEPFQPREPG